MDLYVIRHAAAYESDPERWPDDRDRPLTAKGVRRFRALARLLGGFTAAPQALLASPLARAWQTAQILEGDAGWPSPDVCPALEPGAPPTTLLAALAPHAEREALALVGHEPDLHTLIGYLMTGSDSSGAVEMKKGAVACLRFEGPPHPGGGTLRWLLTPRVARAAGG